MLLAAAVLEGTSLVPPAAAAALGYEVIIHGRPRDPLPLPLLNAFERLVFPTA